MTDGKPGYRYGSGNIRLENRNMMLKKEFGITLNAPAFLGDAEQKGVWRTPPIKAMVREWWRVAAAPAEAYRHERLRPIEGKLFGNAWLDNDFSKSRVRMALEHWQCRENDSGMDNDPKVDAPGSRDFRTTVGSQLNYLGYGPLIDPARRRSIKSGAALQANETNTLSLACPDGDAGKIEQALQLIDWFGAFGGRSRNGWGSLGLSGQCALTRRHASLTGVLRPLADCLKLDWPHAIGQDDQGPLIWESSASFNDWQAAMRFLAQTKIGFRTQKALAFGQVPTPHPQPLERHLLAYPVTNHRVTERGWGGDGRLANQLRFKLYRDASGQLRTRIVHTPHACPLPVPSALQQIAVWQTVHRWLDQQSTLTRLGA
jgi:CRISPR-associated protein Cmr1